MKKGGHDMVGPSKILTVSYGTFSCTLEGFDEPFNTMKAIAEYFRDLAADDRYFGAEPPTPDAEMLHRIAEREIQRRVEAKINEHGVILRQTDAAPQPAPIVADAAPVEPVAAPLVIAAAPVLAAPVVAEPHAVAEPEPVVIDEPELTADAEEIADTLEEQEIAAVAEVAPEIVAEEDAPAPADVFADAEVASEAAEDEVEEISLDAIMAAAETALPAPVAMPEAEAAPDSLAAKLSRIRAVVETVRAGQPVAFDEDEPADLQSSGAETFDSDFGFELDLSEDAPELIAAEATRAAARADAEIEAEAVATDDIAPIILETEEEDEASYLDEEIVTEAAETVTAEAEAGAEEPGEAAQSVAEDYEDDTYAEATPDEDSALLARLTGLAQSTSAEMQAEGATSDHPASARQDLSDAEDLRLGDNDHADATTSEADDVHEDHPSFYERARARVIRIGKAATRLGGAKTDDHADDHVDETVAHAEMMQPEADEVPPMAEHAAFADQHDEDGNDVERLMEEAKVKLEGAENRRRFSAIAHLKAAVAATLADRKMQPETASESAEGEAATEMSLYRDDLSKAVRPRRPAAETGATTRRPNLDARPAPLVLVSEQRVDRRDDAHDGAAIRPRRVSAGSRSMLDDDDRLDSDDLDDMAPESSSNFAEFAESLGAHSLTELLEAAAVYTASVEGQEHFTRPQLLRKVEFVSTRGEYNREDGLRSFGMLLRQGKIQKVAPGQFAIADASRYATEARRAAH